MYKLILRDETVGRIVSDSLTRKQAIKQAIKLTGGGYFAEVRNEDGQIIYTTRLKSIVENLRGV